MRFHKAALTPTLSRMREREVLRSSSIAAIK